MAICNSVQTILPQQCIGDSLPIINNNFSNLNTDICTLLTLINELSSNMNKVNLPYAKFGEFITVEADGAAKVSQGRGTFKRVLNSVDINYLNTGISLNTSNGVMTVPAGAYEIRLSMGSSTAQNAGLGTSAGTTFGLALRETSTTNYVFKGLQGFVKDATGDIYIQQGKIFLSSQTLLELCLRVGGIHSNPIINVASGTLEGGVNLFSVEFWKLT